MDSKASKQQNQGTHATIRIVVIGTFLTAILVAGGYFLVHSRMQQHAKSSSITKDSQPSHPTILPDGVSIKDLGGWQQLKTPNGTAVSVYTDTIDNVPISVSQQPLPESIKQAGDGIEKLAKNYNATDTINAKGTKVYIGTSAKGPQSVIFTKDSLLVLIKAQKNISNKAWAKYIASLV